MDLKKNVRVWRVRPTSKSGIEMSTEGVSVVGSPDSFISLTPKGIALNSPNIHFSSGGVVRELLFKDQITILGMIPSTLVTPNARQVINFPCMNALATVGEAVAVMVPTSIGMGVV